MEDPSSSIQVGATRPFTPDPEDARATANLSTSKKAPSISLEPPQAQDKGPAMEKRNLFALMRSWIKKQGGEAYLKHLMTLQQPGGAAGGGLGLGGQDESLDIYELLSLLRRAVPDVTNLEGQLFMALVDVNGDEKLTLAELQSSLVDCRDVDGVVVGLGDPSQRKAIEQELSSRIQELRGASKASEMSQALDSLATLRDPKYVTLQEVCLTFKRLLSPSISSESLRVLVAHVARTARVSSDEPGLPPSEVLRTLGITPPPCSSSTTLGPNAAPGGPSEVKPEAAYAAGWVLGGLGGERDIFKLLRHHVKKNRAQMAILFPQGQALDFPQVRVAVGSMLETRSGEPMLTGRELRVLVAMLDVNGSGTLTRDEFEGGLKTCRELREGLMRFEADARSVTLSSRVWGGEGGAGGGEEEEEGKTPLPPLPSPPPSAQQQQEPSAKPPSETNHDTPTPPSPPAPAPPPPPLPVPTSIPTWGSFLDRLGLLSNLVTSKKDYCESLLRSLDSRGKGRLDLIEVKKLLFKLLEGREGREGREGASAFSSDGVGGMEEGLMMAVLCHLDLWDPSSHGLLR